MKKLNFFFGISILLFTSAVFAHGLSVEDASFVIQNVGAQPLQFVVLGAKHMVTGYDHLLFILGVVFFLHRLRDVFVYVTLFSIGHSITLIIGVLGKIHADPYLIDAIIAISVIYKGVENLGGFAKLGKYLPNTQWMVFGFGLFHGLGLATKLQSLYLSPEGLWVNLLSFNIGVELGQIIALSVMLVLMRLWRRQQKFKTQAIFANTLIVMAGFFLLGYQAIGHRSERFEISLANETSGDVSELEYKVRMKAGDTLVYDWNVPGISDPEFFYSDLHGETGPKVIEFRQGLGSQASGSLTAPFDGIFGWYFQNQAPHPVVIQLRLRGGYQLIPPGEAGNEMELQPVGHGLR